MPAAHVAHVYAGLHRRRRLAEIVARVYIDDRAAGVYAAGALDLEQRGQYRKPLAWWQIAFRLMRCRSVKLRPAKVDQCADSG